MRAIQLRKNRNKSCIGSIVGTVLGTVAGGLYFWLEESSIPKESNAQYLSPWTTDLLAWICGATLVTQGLRYRDGIITFIGSSIVSIHLAQFAAHKVIQNRILSRSVENESA